MDSIQPAVRGSDLFILRCLHCLTSEPTSPPFKPFTIPTGSRSSPHTPRHILGKQMQHKSMISALHDPQSSSGISPTVGMSWNPPHSEERTDGGPHGALDPPPPGGLIKGGKTSVQRAPSTNALRLGVARMPSAYPRIHHLNSS
eukprot:5042724-Alexandrium_andersonii.AAC.1